MSFLKDLFSGRAQYIGEQDGAARGQEWARAHIDNGTGFHNESDTCDFAWSDGKFHGRMKLGDGVLAKAYGTGYAQGFTDTYETIMEEYTEAYMEPNPKPKW